MTETGPSPADPFCVLLRVRYAECDAQQVVFNARYADFADVAMTEFFRTLFGGYQALLAQGLDSQVVHMETSWRAPARFDDVLALYVTAQRLGTTSYTLRVAFRHHASGRELAVTDLTYVLVDAGSYAKTPLPEALRAGLLAGAPGRCVDLAGLGTPTPAAGAPA